MTARARIRDRLPSATAALAIQLAIAALLAVSFEAVRQAAPEKETILNLPPLVRPAPAPMVIDARGRRRTSPAAAPPPVPQSPAPAAPVLTAPPATAAPSAAGAVPAPGRRTGQAAPGPAPADCAPQNLASLTPAERALCPPPPRADANEIPLNPQSHVKDAPYWEAERENSRAPFALPGAAAGPFGVLLSALLNPGAFADKHSYSYGPALTTKAGTPDPDAPPAHVSDDAFRKALQAANDRKRMLYGKPPAAAAQPAAPPAQAAAPPATAGGAR